MSVLALAPWAQPWPQWPRLMQGARPSYSREVMALSEGHQCQPSVFMALPITSPVRPSGSGGTTESFGG
jgi:hypothetical protein